MGSLVFLIPIALLLGAAALGAFLWSLKSGQYEDLDGAAERILIDDEEGEGWRESDPDLRDRGAPR